MKLSERSKFISRIIEQRCFFIVRRFDRGICTFDDPTGVEHLMKNNPLWTPDKSPGPIRTLLCFSNEDKAAEYCEKELYNTGKVDRILLENKGRVQEFIKNVMINNKIYWFLFDRECGDKPISMSYRAWLVSLKHFILLYSCSFSKVEGAINEAGHWNPGESFVRVSDEAQRMIWDYEKKQYEGEN